MQEEGFIAKLLYPEGTKDVKLGQVVAIIVENKDDVSKFKDYSSSTSASQVSAHEKKPDFEEKRSCPASMERPSSTPDLSFAGAGRVIAYPLAKKTASENRVDLTKVKESGPNDRIITSDVD
jgi:pyruvate dehydrogenase E2 component (dihydrolipoamide acetyltransferase)